MDIKSLLRKNIATLVPYSCARNEFEGEASVYLDANESPYNDPYNRYPDPLQIELKKKIRYIKNVPITNMFLGNGSDEAIDLLYRAFCEPKIDNVVAIEPTYGMYKVCAAINDVEYRKVLLDSNFDFEAYKLIDAASDNTKIIWLCSPNNPTGNSLNHNEIHKLLQWFKGLVVIDEAYIDFSSERSFVEYLGIYPNLVVLQTFSKAWANASIRLGMAFASEEVIAVLNKIKYPYNVNLLTQQHAALMLDNDENVKTWVAETKSERQKLINELAKLNYVRKIFPSDANFLLIKADNANYIYQTLIERGIIIRNRSRVSLCEGCLRITVGSLRENLILLKEMAKIHV